LKPIDFLKVVVSQDTRFQVTHCLDMHLDIIECIGADLDGGALGWEQQVPLGERDSLDPGQLLVIKNGLTNKKVN
tara:strand:- start:1051 stop:1275 length:225 start_codon:yes stop_codon:yes gene_type:complete